MCRKSPDELWQYDAARRTHFLGTGFYQIYEVPDGSFRLLAAGVRIFPTLAEAKTVAEREYLELLAEPPDGEDDMSTQSYEVVQATWFGAASETTHNPLLFKAARQEVRKLLIAELGQIRGRWVAFWFDDNEIVAAMSKAGIYTVNGKFLDGFIEFFKSDLGQMLLKILLGLLI